MGDTVQIDINDDGVGLRNGEGISLQQVDQPPRAVFPPSMTICDPVMNGKSSEASASANVAISSGVAIRHQIGFLDSSSAVMTLLHSVASSALAMKQEDISVERRAPEEIASIAETMVRIPSNSRSTQIGISIRGTGRTLLTSEIDLINEIALHAGRRFDDLEREEERIERVRTEGRLIKQLVEAELRVLRSQINPHFLFNSLNTIASLVPSEPDKAEKITVRLSSIFRYVLTHSDRPFTCLGEEMECSGDRFLFHSLSGSLPCRFCVRVPI